MLGEFFREAGVLVLVFGFLDHDDKGYLPLIGALFVLIGMKIEVDRE